MIIYEVNSDTVPTLASEYEAFLKKHVPEMLTLDGFVAATVFRQNAADDGQANHLRTRFCIQYQVESHEKLNAYLRERAPQMRQEGIQRFGDRVQYSRRVLEKLWNG